MSNLYTIQKQTLTGIADAIREKTGSSDSYLPVEMATAIAQIETGGAAYNIAFGDTAPEDTSKLWVKSAEPAAIRVTSKVVVANESMEAFVSALPEAKRLLSAVNVASKIYLFGGLSESGSEEDYKSGIHVYDPASRSVSTIDAVLPQGTYGMAAAAVGTKIYLFGGYGDSTAPFDTIAVFDTQTNEIYTLATKLPEGLRNAAAAAGNEKIFVFGGYGSSLRQNAIYVFDPRSETITALNTKLPTETDYHSAVAVGGKVYIFGGSTGQAQSGMITSAIHVFDMHTYTLTTLDVSLPIANRAIAAAAVGTKIYLFGGRTAGLRSADIQVFDTETYTLTTLNTQLPVRTAFAAAAAVGERIYVFGGKDDTVDLQAIHEFVAELPLAENSVLIEIGLADNTVNLLPDMEIGVSNVYMGNADGVAEKVPAALYRNGAWVEIFIR